MNHLVLVRHAEPSDGERCHGARSDPGLSPLGRRQARGLPLRVRVLAGEFGSVRRLVCSPALRARATAAPLAEALGLDPVVDPRWRERDWGTWEGRPWEDLWPEAPHEVTHDPEAYLAWTPPEGETPDEVAARLAPAISDVRGAPGTTVVVTHAGAVRQALVALLGVSLQATLAIDVGHARCTVLATSDDAATLTRLGA